MTIAVDWKERQKLQWGAAAPAWDRRFEWYSRAFQPLIAWCCQAAGVASGMRVLDIACGSGQPALTAARQVGRSGRVVAIDISPDMLAAARRRAQADGLDNIEFVEMDAEQLRFEDGTFDAITCACGLMFFPDAERAVAEMRRVLKPRGRLAVAVWDEPAKSPFLTVAGQAVGQFFPPAPPDPNAPGAFRFSRPGELDVLLRRAGFSDLASESLPMSIALASTTEYWQVFTEMAAGVKEKIDTLSETDRARLRAIVDESANRFMADGGLRLVATPLGISACAA